MPFSRKHPLSTYLSSMLVIYAGGMLANFFLGEPVLGVFTNNQQLALYSAVWWASIPKFRDFAQSQHPLFFVLICKMFKCLKVFNILLPLWSRLQDLQVSASETLSECHEGDLQASYETLNSAMDKRILILSLHTPAGRKKFMMASRMLSKYFQTDT